MASGPPESRAPADLVALSVTLMLRSGPIAGEVVSLEITQTVVDFHPPDPPQLPLGVVVTLEFATPGLKKPVRLSAMVVGRTEVTSGRRYSFQFKLKEGQDAGDLFRLFNRRASYRALAHKPVEVHILPTDPDLRKAAQPIVADLHDISASGISIIVTPEQDMRVAQDNVFLRFELPTSDQPVEVLTTIRYRVLMHSKAVRYGCAFNPNSPGFMSMESRVVKYLMRHQQDLMKYKADAD